MTPTKECETECEPSLGCTMLRLPSSVFKLSLICISKAQSQLNQNDDNLILFSFGSSDPSRSSRAFISARSSLQPLHNNSPRCSG
ncbi:Uncharacterized protein HZ326_12715 [Fusarium oxysporum f. sp. albedinis]|nr:Uncharacterized protein HZ326_12715 [Fusarium oxysporum f. sp. albedinis]